MSILQTLNAMRLKYKLKDFYLRIEGKMAARSPILSSEVKEYFTLYNPLIQHYLNIEDSANIRWITATSAAFSQLSRWCHIDEETLIKLDELGRFSAVTSFSQSIISWNQRGDHEMCKQMHIILHETVLVKEKGVRLSEEAERDIDYLWAIMAYNSAYRTMEEEHEAIFERFLEHCKEKGTLAKFKPLPAVENWPDFSEGFNHAIQNLIGNRTLQY